MVEKGKGVFVGDVAVGKTSIIHKQMKDDQIARHTARMDRTKCEVEYLGVGVPLNIFDSSGAEEFRTMVPLFARGSHVAVVVYDLSYKTSFDHVKNWVTYLRENSAVRHIIIVGNKADLPPKITAEEEAALAAETASKVIQTSACTGMGIDTLFAMIAQHVADDADLVQSSTTTPIAEKEKKPCSC
jgi:small GTP-binding protein